MMLILRDDGIVETSEFHTSPPDWAEWTDIEKSEYEFCDEIGQRYRGVLLQPRVFSDEK